MEHLINVHIEKQTRHLLGELGEPQDIEDPAETTQRDSVEPG
jgi:hypothetical protein